MGKGQSPFPCRRGLKKALVAGMAEKRGGPRHFSKPFIEAGLLLQVLLKHEDRVQDFKAYEHLSSGSTPDPKGLIYCLGLLQDLVKIAPQAELHPQPLRDAMLRLLTNKPLLNTSGHNGAVWCNARAERVNVLLAHLRKLKRSGPNSRCANMLTGLEYTQLADLLKLVQNKPEEGQNALPLENGEVNESHQKKLKKQESPEHQPKKRLKKHNSDVSMDSQGFPSFLKTPDHEKKRDANPSRLLQKRVGQKVHGEDPEHGHLKTAMGVGHLKKCMKRPAAACSLRKPAACIPAAGDTECTGAWHKINRTLSTKPPRAYLCGCKNEGEKPKHIVEVTEKMSIQYVKIIDIIKAALEKDGITKEDARKMRVELCKKYP